MGLFTRNRLDEVFEKRLAAVEEAVAEIRRLARNCDADVNDFIDKMNRLAGRLAKRAAAEVPPPPFVGQGGPPGPLLDPISAQIHARRARGGIRPLKEEADDGVLPGR